MVSSSRMVTSLATRENQSVLLSLGFSESPDRQGINLAARTYKTKQGPDGGVLAASSMLKSDRVVGKVNTYVFSRKVSPPFPYL